MRIFSWGISYIFYIIWRRKVSNVKKKKNFLIYNWFQKIQNLNIRILKKKKLWLSDLISLRRFYFNGVNNSWFGIYSRIIKPLRFSNNKPINLFLSTLRLKDFPKNSRIFYTKKGKRKVVVFNECENERFSN